MSPSWLSAKPAATSLHKRSGTTEVKVIGLRRKIAERMAKSASEIPHFTYVEEIDVTALESLRRHLNSKKAEGKIKLTRWLSSAWPWCAFCRTSRSAMRITTASAT